MHGFKAASLCQQSHGSTLRAFLLGRAAEPAPIGSLLGLELSRAEAAGDAVVDLDEPVDGFGTTVAGPADVAVGHLRRSPRLQRPPQPGDLGHGTGREGGDDLVPRPSMFAS
jgi:hypothetical protein